MVQDQLTEYISSQLKLGVSRDAVKSALIAAGWGADDVEDTLKKVGGGGSPVMQSPSTATTTPANTTSQVAAAKQPFTGGAFSVNSPSSSQSGQQSIRVSDLVSASGAAGPAAGAAKKTPASAAVTTGAVTGTKPKAAWGGRIASIAEIVVIVALGGLAGYLYFQNAGLATKVTALSGQSTDVTSQISGLNSQVQALNASNTALTAAAGSLTKENADLQTNLSFLAAPVSTGTSTPATTTVSVTGTLAQKRPSYILTTAYGVVVYVKNSADARVVAVLQPLVSSTAPAGPVELTGTHVQGSQYLTVTAVNGTPL